MLFLLFQIGNDRYALEARHAVEVVPFLALQKIPQAARGVAGLFNYRGRPVAAVDLCELTFGRPARELLSTRIIVVNFADPAGKPQWLGLIAEHATGMMRRAEQDFVRSGVQAGHAPYLGPVVMDEQGVIQLLNIEHLLTRTVRDLLFAETRYVAAPDASESAIEPLAAAPPGSAPPAGAVA